MRPSLRFLAVAVVGWVGIRAATLGMVPGAEVFSIRPSAAKPSPVLATQFPPIEPIVPGPAPAMAPLAVPYATEVLRPLVVPVYYAYHSAPTVPAPVQPAIWSLPEPRRQFYAPSPQLDDWPLSQIAAASIAPARSQTVDPMQSTAPAIVAQRLDRIQLTMWAMLRSRQSLTGTTSLASGGQLGASQAGARLFYNFTPSIAAVVRSSSEVNRRGGEVAAGVRVQPLRSVPVWITAERRQQLGRYGGGRNAFALFAEGGVYDRPGPWGFILDGYAQAGVVGLSSRDLFFDGGATFTRPVYRESSGGFGVWGGVQPGLYRVDAGPRVTMKVRRNVRVHLDWRQRLAGNAEPGSGPVLTLAGDF
ncbi:MAG TPA: hypothetical protein VJM15_05735 [Sphingomicrobium sp.]|nr:hypothetical protein [Sphingomicrobium sp.]